MKSWRLTPDEIAYQARKIREWLAVNGNVARERTPQPEPEDRSAELRNMKPDYTR